MVVGPCVLTSLPASDVVGPMRVAEVWPPVAPHTHAQMDAGGHLQDVSGAVT